jgi:hypothetical protein
VVGIEPGSMRIGKSRQAWGAWPISHWHGRIGMNREERCGQVRSGRHGVARCGYVCVARQAWIDSNWPALTRQARFRVFRLAKLRTAVKA